MKIGVIGVGVVGGAVLKAFSEKFETIGYDVVGDYASESNHDKIVSEADICFICVPSPTVKFRQDLNFVNVALARLAHKGYKGVVALKSTVLPGSTSSLKRISGLRLVHNPEFVTAARPFEDFMEQKAVLLGGDAADSLVVASTYRVVLPDAEIKIYHQPEYTEIAKYMRNNYLALKLTFSNTYYDLCKKMNVDYNMVKEAMLSQGGIEQGHWKVPGPDGGRGYSGMCLVKDTRAMATFMQEEMINGGIIAETEKYNQGVRPHDKDCHELKMEKR